MGLKQSKSTQTFVLRHRKSIEIIWKKSKKSGFLALLSTNSISIKRYEEEEEDEDEEEEDEEEGDDQKNQKCRFFQNERTFNPNDYK